MLTFFLEKLGIDSRQFKILSLAFLRRDFRASTMSVTLRHGRTGKRTFLILLFFYFISGLVFIPIILAISDIFLSATLLMTYTMVMIGGLIMVEYYSIVIAPEDYYVLGYQPISPRTFTAVKFANILFYVLIFSSILSLPGIISFGWIDFLMVHNWPACPLHEVLPQGRTSALQGGERYKLFESN